MEAFIHILKLNSFFLFFLMLIFLPGLNYFVVMHVGSSQPPEGPVKSYKPSTHINKVTVYYNT